MPGLTIVSNPIKIGLNRFGRGNGKSGFHLPYRAVHELVKLVWLNRFSWQNGESGFTVPGPYWFKSGQNHSNRLEPVRGQP